jgi:cellulose synthase/poly-beta-1,6-N-acetylglucosamine synthase-like glycosyltransferase
LIVLEIIFWTCVGAMLYSYIVYPLLTSVLLLIRRSPVADRNPAALEGVELPRVFVLFAAFNEETVIGKKLETLLRSDYPQDRLSIWVGSDCSTDRTDEIVQSFAHKYGNVALQRFDERSGKSNIINRLLDEYRAEARPGDLLVLTDANVMFEPDTIRELVRPFSNPLVGLVGGSVKNVETGLGISGQERTYIQRENRIKYREGELWGTVMGAFGACYAIRPELFPSIPHNILMEDFYVTMHVLNEGKKAIINPNAVCLEDVSVKVGEEFKRKRRISAGNFQNLARYWKLLFSFRPVGFALLSHKVLRWLGPFFLLLALACSAVLAVESEVYLVLFLAQAGLIVLSLIDLALQRANVHSPLRLLSYFYAMNLALFSGFLMFMRGVHSSVWRPTERAK